MVLSRRRRGRRRMNLGFYVHQTSDTKLNSDIYQLLNSAIEQNLVDDASLFYNQIDYNPNVKKFGSFNSTDLWSFNGTLVVTSLASLPLAESVVNRIKLIYMYCKDEIASGDLNELMRLLSIDLSMTVVAKSAEDKKEFYRVTKKEIPAIKNFNAEEILKV